MPRAPWTRPAVSVALRPLSWIWGAVAGGRRAAFAAGLVRGVDLGVPVISVGNLVVGGSGKTPMILHLLERLPPELAPTLVLARGYGAAIERDGVRLNDEMHMLRTRRPEALYAQGADRAAAAQALARRLAADGRPAFRSVLLDDGHQHLRIRRDLELVLFDAAELARGPRLLPAGPWREGLRAARSAHALVLTRCDEAGSAATAAAVRRLERALPGLPVFRSRHAAVALREGGARRPPGSLAGRTVGLACGIARPASFERLVAELGARPRWTLAGADHDAFDERARAGILARLRAEPVDALVITEKDAPKLAGLDPGVPVLVLEIGLDLGADAEAFDAFLSARFSELIRGRSRGETGR